VSGLAYFAGATGCQLIAEGIESEEERGALLELGVRLGQGFLLGRPAPIESAARTVSR
jgi:EAL domain-containing protein (putative c-di-GMP-specific phosphodiesterase class I)